MKTVTFFSTEEELQQLTNLDHYELWNVGFDLNDWDWGFVSNAIWLPYYNTDSPDNAFEFWLLNHMHSYCMGYKCIHYKEKFYYMLYHG